MSRTQGTKWGRPSSESELASAMQSPNTGTAETKTIQEPGMIYLKALFA